MKKICLITGAGQGLGAAIAEKFAEENYDLILTYLDSKKETEYLAENLETQYNVSVQVQNLDVTDEEMIKGVFEKINKLDVLVNNAAYNNDTLWNEKTVSEFQKTLNTNLIGPYLMTKYAHPLLEKSHGNIVNIASTNGIDTMYPESLDYDASKAALINMTKNLASALAPKVRVNAVAPGWIETHKTKDMDPKFKDSEIKKIALQRFAGPKEIAEVVYFVASEKASYITGTIIRVDGGVNYEL